MLQNALFLAALLGMTNSDATVSQQFGFEFAPAEYQRYVTDGRVAPREHKVDMQHLELHLNLEPSKGQVHGRVIHRFRPIRKDVDSIFLDAIKMQIHSVVLHEAGATKQVPFDQDDSGITLNFPRTLNWDQDYKIEIKYSATPKRGIYFIGWNDPKGINRKQIWTQGQGIDNRHWIPLYDDMNDKITTDIHLDFDARYQVISNGVQLPTATAEPSDQSPRQTELKHWHYRMNQAHPPYVIMLAIGEYAFQERQSKSGITIRDYYYPDRPDTAGPTYKYGKEMFDFFEQEIGVAFPWETYANIPVQDFLYGAMENTTATIFGDFWLVNSREAIDGDYVGVNAHELAHQWFGDFVTAKSKNHIWLQEGFATYYPILFAREAYGKDEYDWRRRNSFQGALRASESNQYPLSNSKTGGRVYAKGASVLAMLSEVLGREQYNRAIKHYLENHRYGNVDSEDLPEAIQQSLGLSLDWFFDQWVNRPGEPAYKVEFHKSRNVNNQAIGVFSVTQTHSREQGEAIFRMPFEFEVHYTDGTKSSLRRDLSSVHQMVEVPLKPGIKIAYVLFDPDNRVLKRVDFKKPTSMLLRQTIAAKSVLDRYDALLALRDTPIKEKRPTLHRVFKRESFHACRAEATSQLAKDSDPSSKRLLRHALHSADVKVRKAAIEAVPNIPSKDIPLWEERLRNDPSYRVVESVLAKLSYGYPDQAHKWLQLVENQTGNSARNIELRRLELLVEIFDDQTAQQQLIEYAGVSYDFRITTRVIRFLKDQDILDAKLTQHLLNHLLLGNPKQRSTAESALRHYAKRFRYRQLIAEVWKSIEKQTTWNKESLSKLQSILGDAFESVSRSVR